MSTNSSLEMSNQAPDPETGDSAWESLYKVGGVAALISVLVALLDILITFLPGGGMTDNPATVVDWFTLFQDNWFLGLRALGLFNIIGTALMVPVFLALYAVHRRINEAFAALAAILLFVGTAIYIANNTAFSMLALSGDYAAATTDAQRSLLVAAGKAMLAQAEDFTPGAFMGFLFTEAAGIVMGAVMLRGGVFSKWAAWAGLLGYGCLLVFTICATFVPAIFDVVMVFAMAGGLLDMAWFILIARRLFRLGRLENDTLPHRA